MPRPPKVATTSDMVRAAQLYFREKKSRGEIAALMRTDIRGVTWLLNEAEAKNLVRINIHETTESNLETRIKQRFPHLVRVMVVPGPPIKTIPHYEFFLKRAGILAADYFDDIVDHHTPGPLHVGISGGETILEFVNAVPERLRKNLHIHATALVGRARVQRSASHINPDINATILWSRSGRLPGRGEYLTVAPYPVGKPSPETRSAARDQLAKLAQSKLAEAVIKPMDKIEIAFAGIGVLNPGATTPVQRARLSMTDLIQSVVSAKELERENAVADMSYSLIDKNGDSYPEWQFFLTAGCLSGHPGVDFYKHLVDRGKRVVTIAGPFKMAAIKATLAAKAFNVWITDEFTARRVAEGA
jgi:DNA-binding transcriptional regulator LsrR (DeoR family)